MKNGKGFKRIIALATSIAMSAITVPVFEVGTFAENVIAETSSQNTTASSTDEAVDKVIETVLTDGTDSTADIANESDEVMDIFTGITSPTFKLNAKDGYSINSDEAFNLQSVYTNAETYAADSAIFGLIDPGTGQKNEYRAYEQILNHRYSYEIIAENLLEDKGLTILSRAYSTITKLVNDGPEAIKGLSTEQMYEVILMDYLNYKETSDKNNYTYIQKNAKYAKSLFDALQKEYSNLKVNEAIKTMTKEEAEEISKVWSPQNGSLKNSTKLFGEITNIATSGLDYLTKLVKVAALTGAQEENVNFLKAIKSQADSHGNTALSFAADHIIMETNSAYSSLTFADTTISSALSFVLKKGAMLLKVFPDLQVLSSQ